MMNMVATDGKSRKKGIRVIRTPSNGGEQSMLCLPLDMLNGWLLGMCQTGKCDYSPLQASNHYPETGWWIYHADQ
jgi:hypothetical protein